MTRLLLMPVSSRRSTAAIRRPARGCAIGGKKIVIGEASHQPARSGHQRFRLDPAHGRGL